MAQLVERILGKDEVPGSNPGSSSKRQPFLRERLFGLYRHFLKPKLKRDTKLGEGTAGVWLYSRFNRVFEAFTLKKPVHIIRSEIGKLAFQAENGIILNYVEYRVGRGFLVYIGFLSGKT